VDKIAYKEVTYLKKKIKMKRMMMMILKEARLLL
jgi:hypothetical protein